MLVAPEFDSTTGEDKMVHVIAIITARPGLRAELLKLVHANLAAVRAEQGCIEYGPAIDVPGFGGAQAVLGEDTFVFVEKWESAEALRLHFTQPHMIDYLGKSKELIATRAVHVLEPV
jgi:quinol monooxygenase YgiN